MVFSGGFAFGNPWSGRNVSGEAGAWHRPRVIRGSRRTHRRRAPKKPAFSLAKTLLSLGSLCPSHRLGVFSILSSGEGDCGGGNLTTAHPLILEDKQGTGLVTLHERFPPVAHLMPNWGWLSQDARKATQQPPATPIFVAIHVAVFFDTEFMIHSFFSSVSLTGGTCSYRQESQVFSLVDSA